MGEIFRSRNHGDEARVGHILYVRYTRSNRLTYTTFQQGNLIGPGEVLGVYHTSSQVGGSHDRTFVRHFRQNV